MVPVKPASAPPELQYPLADSGAKVFVYDQALAASVDAAKSGFPDTIEHTLSLREGGTDRALTVLAQEAPEGQFEDVPSETAT